MKNNQAPSDERLVRGHHTMWREQPIKRLSVSLGKRGVSINSHRKRTVFQKIRIKGLSGYEAVFSAEANSLKELLDYATDPGPKKPDSPHVNKQGTPESQKMKLSSRSTSY